MFCSIRSIIRRRVLSSRLSALVLLFQRSPLVQMLFPEARILGGAGLGEITKWTVATITGLGAYDTVAGATTISELTPVYNSTSVPAAVGSSLAFSFQCTGTPSIPKSWSVSTLPAGLVHANAVNNTIDSITGIPTAAGNYSVTVKAWENSGNTGNSFAKTFTVSIDTAIITTQPPSPTISSGGTTTLTVVGALGTGTALTYQWYSGVSPSTTTPISGATTASYTTPALSAAANYWVQVKRSGVVATPVANTPYTVLANSSTAAVSVAVASSITTNPVSTTINSGATATLSVVASGTAPFTYQWYQGASGTTTTPVGTNSASFTTPTLSATTSYWVKVTNVANTSGANSIAATVTVNQPSAIATNPASTTINSGAATTLSVVASGTAPFTYQWYQGTSGTTTTPVGTNSASFTTPALSATTSYWVKVTNVANIAGASSTAATITVNVIANFSSWASGYGLTGANALPDADPDYDGLKNGLEYVLGGNPTVNDASTLNPSGVKSGTNFLFTFKRSHASEADTTVSVEYGIDFNLWNSVAIGPATSGFVSVTAIDASADTVVVTIPYAETSRFFARLKVQK
jgi:hypothetical protein